jgi:hypothetical protein
MKERFRRRTDGRGQFRYYCRIDSLESSPFLRALFLLLLLLFSFRGNFSPVALLREFSEHMYLTGRRRRRRRFL